MDATPPPDDRFAEDLRGFGPLGLLAIVAILLGDAVVKSLSGFLVLAWAWRSRTPWRDIGFSRPRSWARVFLVGIPLGIAFKLLMKAVVMPLLGAEPVNQAYHYLAGNTAALPWAIYMLTIGAGFGEETVFRGFLFERLGRLLPAGPSAKVLILLLTSTLFSLAHYSVQGLAGSEQAFMTGMVFGAIYLATGQLWIPMVAHAAFDLVALALIYWDVEAAVAHSIFS
jgi:membrane protease YdiL (CAAX protease family)